MNVEAQEQRKEWIYHIVFEYSKGSERGKGTLQRSFTGPLDTRGAIDTVVEMIREENGFDDVILLNWIQLRK